ncbi:hypothetical protein Bhyg_09359 [Pseudolycoriella hygida]|uniref:Uncharacterized protein n=1 Tax=Pseudolycoriella hygida TaxID=35572 RepID=A0A9Q0N6K7_9DIPT|nr:hypothetical protein Bhyg_09359 [Pseudolycoriella hygida]
MGNSGSAHSAVPNSDEHNNYRHSSSQWSQSIPRDSTNRHTHQIKVLPELKGATRLRATNNGNILHGGGTLTGRRELVLHNGVFRTRSTSSTRSPDPSELNVRVPHPHQLMQRSQTQLNIIRNPPGLTKLPENDPIKRSGSEPDLRGSGDERNDLEKKNSRVESSLPKTKLIRNKKKKAAPPPPTQANVNQSSSDRKALNYDPSRFGWKKQNDKSLNKENSEEREAPKKLRLFKTKAETQKVNEVTVIPKEIEKPSTIRNHLNRYSNVERQSFNSLPYHNNDRSNEFDRLSDHHEETVPPLPPLFRREKSFDLSLLMQQKESNSGVFSSANKQLQMKSMKDITQRSIPVGRVSSVESKVRLRKFSQPVTSVVNSENNTESDFKKELLAATRRRSQNLLRTKDESFVTNETNENREESEKNLGIKLLERSEKKPMDDLKDEDRRSIRRPQEKEESEGKNQQESATKTFYFGMTKDQSMLVNDEALVHKSNRDLLTVANQFRGSDSESTDSSLSSALIDHFPMHLIQTIDDHLNDPDSNPNGIQVHLRPTLPRRQYEVPRFSPAAAWRNLSQAECDVSASPDETTNICDQQNYSSYSANDDIEDSTLTNQQLLESRIERVYRDPVPGFLDNKSGDSGISGDAGMLQEHAESPNRNNDKIGPFLSPWTPLQDLDEESSSDDAEMANSKDELTKLVNRGHIFSLSLPRESHLLGYGGENLQLADVKSFNSLQKLKRTVSSAFGGSNDSREQNRPAIYHNENWMLSRSAPNSIDNNLYPTALNATSDCGDDNEDFVAYEVDRNENVIGIEEKNHNVSEYRSYNRRPRQQAQSEHCKILPPSFNYLTGGKHMMYLPNEDIACGYGEPDVCNDRQNKAEGDQQMSSPELSQYAFKIKNNNSGKSRNHHRFTFQSTVRQIERRRLAERLSKDAEQKEAQRLSELEAMRRVEEEFQKKRAREKANIRHQLRLYSMGENVGDVTGYTTGHYTSLPIEWKSNGPRDDPDGAVSSPVPSPTSQNYLSMSKAADNEYVDTKTPYISRLIEQKSGKLYRNPNAMKTNIEARTPPTEVLSEFHTTRREYVEYRNSRKSNGNKFGKSGSHSLNPVIYKTQIDEQPSHNYRKSFAHGRSICSSDSDMSGPIIRSKGRHKQRSRSPSPEL